MLPGPGIFSKPLLRWLGRARSRPRGSEVAMRCAVAITSTLAFLFADALAAQRAPDLFAVGNKARDGGRFSMLLRQFRADEPALPERSEAGFREATAQYQGARDIPAGHWVWQKPYWFVFRDGPDAAVQQRQWGPEA